MVVQALRGGGAEGRVGSSGTESAAVLGCDAAGIRVVGSSEGLLRGCCRGGLGLAAPRWELHDRVILYDHHWYIGGNQELAANSPLL